jgi:hypothetical protein
VLKGTTTDLARRNLDFPYSLACLACSKQHNSDFMETRTKDLAKACTNKAYLEKEERYTMKNDNQCILLSYQ